MIDSTLSGMMGKWWLGTQGSLLEAATLG